MSSSRQLMEVVLIVNPYASAVSEARVRAVERELERVAQVRTLLTERPGHGIELAARPAATRWSSSPATAASTRC